MKKNLFLSICSLLVTTFLLFFLVFGWYVSNKEVSANGIFGSTAGDDYELSLKRAEVDSSGQIIGFVDTKNLTLTGLEPGSIFIFSLTIKAKGSEDVSLALSFNEIESILNTDKLVSDGTKVYQAKGDLRIPLYDILNGEVRVNDTTATPASKLLYSYNNTLGLALGDYKIEDTFKTYTLGTVAPTSTAIDKTNSALLKEASIPITASSTETSYYFALEFNEELSSRSIDNFVSSNMYLFQRLKIGRISLERL